MAEVLITDDSDAEIEAIEAELYDRALAGDEVARLFLSKHGVEVPNG